MEANGQPAVLLLLDELVGPLVPELDGSGSVLPLRDLALEGRVLERVVLDVNGEVLLPGLEGHALGHRPAGERSVALQPEVVVQAARVVSLHDEDRLLATLAAAERLRGLLRVALALVLGELRLWHVD